LAAARRDVDGVVVVGIDYYQGRLVTRGGTVSTSDGPIRIVDLGSKPWFSDAIGTQVRTLDELNARCVAYSPDRSLLVGGAPSGGIGFWRVNGWVFLRAMQTGPVTDLAFRPDGALLAAATEDGTIDLWEGPQWSRAATIEAHAERCNSVAFSGNGRYLISCGDDGYYRVHDLADGVVVYSEKEDDDRLLSVAVTLDSEVIALRDDSGQLRRYDTAGSLA
jgi:WD40 repeat protein